MKRLAVVLAALGALLVAAPADARSVPRGWLGVQVDGPLTEAPATFAGEWDLMAASGVENVRVAFDWRETQPVEGGPISFAATDAARRGRGGAAAAGAAGGAPDAATGRRRSRGRAPRRRRAGPAAYTQFLTAPRSAATGRPARCGPSSRRSRGCRSATGRSGTSRTSRATGPSSRSRAPTCGCCKASRRALRAADPGSRTILAGLPNESWIALRKVYKAGGRRAFDAVALHPYTGKPRNVIKLIEFARREMRKYGDTRKPIWLTELSWPASKGKTAGAPGFVTTERGQASRLKLALKLLAKARKRLRIERVVWYTWLSREGSGNAFDWSGLRRVRGDQLLTARSLACSGARRGDSRAEQRVDRARGARPR